MIKKDDLYRDKNLLALARGEACLLRVPGVCKLVNETTVAAHSNQGRHGKGKAQKAHDAYSVWGCARCHRWLDQGYAASQEEKVAAWEAGFRRQIVAWQAIAKNPCLKPVRIGAARRALDWLRQQGVIA